MLVYTHRVCPLALYDYHLEPTTVKYLNSRDLAGSILKFSEQPSAQKVSRKCIQVHVHCVPFSCRALIAGGGAPETEVALRLMEYSQTLSGMDAYCVRGFAEAMEVIPYTLAENAGLDPISVVTELRKRHANGEKTAGINVRKVNTVAL